jgi:hypothetical protein
MFDKYTTVNGIKVKLNPYSEARFKKLQAINQEVMDFITTNSEMTINDIPDEKKESWWRAKAEILWTADVPFPEGFFSNEEFELGLLKDSEDNFIVRRLYI